MDDEADAVEGPGQGPIVVIVVDDDQDSRELTCELLETFGIEAHPSASAEAALAALPSAGAHVVVTDLQLGDGQGGVGLARAVRALRPGIGVVALTGFPAGPDERDPVFDDHLRKPVELDALVAAIRAAAGR